MHSTARTSEMAVNGLPVVGRRSRGFTFIGNPVTSGSWMPPTYSTKDSSPPPRSVSPLEPAAEPTDRTATTSVPPNTST